jgi:hypothetical protein
MQPELNPLSSHPDLELTRLCEAAGFVHHDGWFIARTERDDYDLLRRHPQPPRPYPYGRRLRADARSFAGLGWLFAFAVILWGLLVRDQATVGFGLLLVVMMAAFLYRTTRAIRKGRLLLGRTQKVVGRATLITSSMDRLEVALHPAEPWPTVELELPPAPSRYLLDRSDGYEVLLLALVRRDHVRLVGFRPCPGGDDEGPTASDPT